MKSRRALEHLVGLYVNSPSPPMYEIEGTVRIVAPVEVILGGNCPLDWIRASGARSTEIVRKLSPDETINATQKPTEWSEIPANRGHWTDLQVGDRVIVRLFFAGENRPVPQVRA